MDRAHPHAALYYAYNDLMRMWDSRNARAGDEDDIVLQAFKEQTAQYKQVYEASKVTT